MARKKVELDAFADLNMLKDPDKSENEIEQVFEAVEHHKAVKKAEIKRTIPKRREKKQAIGFAIYPSLYEDLKKIAYIQNISTSKLMDNVLRTYVASDDAQAMISEFDSTYI